MHGTVTVERLIITKPWPPWGASITLALALSTLEMEGVWWRGGTSRGERF